MDRNSAIGLTLIAALLLVYFYWFSPTPRPESAQPVSDTTAAAAAVTPPAETPDSIRAAAYGDLSAFATGTAETITVETADLKVAFSSRGGVLSDVELKNYKTYRGDPLKLVAPENTAFRLLAQYDGREIDLYELYYTSSRSQQGDTTVVTFSAQLTDGSYLRHVYAVPANGYQIRYHLEQRGFGERIGSNHLTLRWDDQIMPLEKDLHDMRNNSTITWFTTDDGYDALTERSSGTELQAFASPLKWVSIKKKFFLSALIADSHFSGGEVSTITNEAQTTVAETAKIDLFIPKTAFIGGDTRFTYYLGPNDYQTIGAVAEDFERNVYLGWPPIYWINKFIIYPVFKFLTTFIGNYGLIITILVILLKLVLFPLSYRSYLSMAKMRVLKPELDEIKERNGDDMQKAQQEQLKLYQQVGVNPISGCIPVLLQMPILFAMFYLFPAAIELRQQSFLWAEDLSTYDSIVRFSFELPFGVGSHLSLFTVIMTVSTLIYTWQNNQLSSVTGPMKSMSYIMPVVFLFFLNSFPAGLTFYYFVSNLVTFAQQAIIRRFVDEDRIRQLLEENRKRIAAGGGKKSRFMARLEEAMKASEETRRKMEEEKKKRKPGGKGKGKQ
jgi:YidC/Oxa1 family membrane protein insertase